MSKMDISSLKGNLRSSMQSTLSLLSDRPIAFCKDHEFERIERMEDSFSLQHRVTQQLGKSMSTEEMVQGVYDSLFDSMRSRR
jgi:hypothetical protein